VLEILVDFAEGWVSQNAKGIEWDTTSAGPAPSAQASALPSLDAVSVLFITPLSFQP
jgi:hypothetical protein